MPSQAVIATTVTNPVTQVATLFLGGASVLKAPGGSGFGVPIESIEVVEAGPGGVSSMEFTVDDPNKEVGITAGTEVQFWNVTANVLRFRGYVDHWSSTPDFGGQGRTHHVICTGVEAWLDWLRVVPAYAPGGPTLILADHIVGLSNSIGGPLYAQRDPGNFISYGNQTFPVGFATAGDLSGTWQIQAGLASVTAGVTLREGLAQLEAETDVGSVPVLLYTVDFLMALREWPDHGWLTGTLHQPNDYTTLTVGDTPASALVAEGLEYAVEPGDVVHEVYIAGGNALGSGLFSDGTGLRGRQGLVTDSTITAAAAALARARTYLAANAPQVRGNFTLSDFTPATTVHAGSLLALTNDEASATGTYRIYEIRKTFLGDGRETWRVAFGGLPPSAVNLIRKLTRAVAA